MPAAIDAAVLDAAFYQMTPPAIVQPFFDLDADLVEARREFEQAERDAREGLERWIEDGIERLKALDTKLAVAGPLEPRLLDRLIEAARLIEERTEAFAMEMARERKKLRRAVKRAKAMSPQFGRLAEEAAASAEILAEREREAHLEAALFFRALHARHTPNNSTGIVIANPADVERLLADAMAL